MWRHVTLVPVPAGVKTNCPSIRVKSSASGPTISVMTYVQERGSSTLTTVSVMLPPPPSPSTRVCVASFEGYRTALAEHGARATLQRILDAAAS